MVRASMDTGMDPHGRVLGAGEVPMRGAGAVGAGTATAAITIGKDTEGAGTQAGTVVAAVSRTNDAE